MTVSTPLRVPVGDDLTLIFGPLADDAGLINPTAVPGTSAVLRIKASRAATDASATVYTVTTFIGDTTQGFYARFTIPRAANQVTGVFFHNVRLVDGDDNEWHTVSADAYVVSAGPWPATQVVSVGGTSLPSAALLAHLADTVDAHDASAVSFIPAGSVSATDVQAAIVEVAAEYTAADSTETAARIAAVAAEQTRAVAAETALAGRDAAIEASGWVTNTRILDGTVAVAKLNFVPALQSALDAEITRATTQEGLKAATTALTAETTNRQNADALLIPLAQKAAVNGVAPLDAAGLVPVVNLPAASSGATANKVAESLSAQPFLAMLARGGEPARLLFLGDSTNDASNEPARLVSNQMAVDWPAWTVRFRTFPAGVPTAATDYAAATTIQTGTSGDILDVYNGSVPSWGSTSFLAPAYDNLVTKVQPHAIVIQIGHGDPQTEYSFYARYVAFVESVARTCPGVPIILTAQPPWTDNQFDLRVRQIQGHAFQQGYGWCNVHQAFLDYGPTWPTDLMADHVHQNAAGSVLWASELKKQFLYDVHTTPKTQAPSSLSSAGENLVKNGLLDLSGGVPSDWAATNCTFAVDTTKFESTLGRSIKVTNGGSGTVAYFEQDIPINLAAGAWVTIAARVYVPATVAGGGANNRSVGTLALIDNTGNTTGEGIVTYGKDGWRWETISRYFPPGVTIATARVYLDVGPSGTLLSTFNIDRISVSRGKLPHDVAFGAVGAQGPAGPNGAEGPPGADGGSSTASAYVGYNAVARTAGTGTATGNADTTLDTNDGDTSRVSAGSAGSTYSVDIDAINDDILDSAPLNSAVLAVIGRASTSDGTATFAFSSSAASATCTVTGNAYAAASQALSFPGGTPATVGALRTLLAGATARKFDVNGSGPGGGGSVSHTVQVSGDSAVAFAQAAGTGPNYLRDDDFANYWKKISGSSGADPKNTMTVRTILDTGTVPGGNTLLTVGVLVALGTSSTNPLQVDLTLTAGGHTWAGSGLINAVAGSNNRRGTVSVALAATDSTTLTPALLAGATLDIKASNIIASAANEIRINYAAVPVTSSAAAAAQDSFLTKARIEITYTGSAVGTPGPAGPAGVTTLPQGRATLVAGTVTVTSPDITANSNVLLSTQVNGGTSGALRVGTRTPGTSFVITSATALDTSVVYWIIMNPGA